MVHDRIGFGFAEACYPIEVFQQRFEPIFSRMVFSIGPHSKAVELRNRREFHLVQHWHLHPASPTPEHFHWTEN
jgi:hypothetical protein